MSQGPGNEEGQDAHPWPDYIEHGLEMFYGEAVPLEEVEAFALRWGGHHEQEPLVHALSEERNQEIYGKCIPVKELKAFGKSQP